MNARRAVGGLLLLVLPCVPAACDGDKDAPPVEDVLARERAVATFLAHRDQPKLALAELRPLIDRRRPALADLVLAAGLEILADDLDGCRELLARAAEIDAEDPRVCYVRARLAFLEGDIEAEIEHLRCALARAPDDLPAKVALGTALSQREEGDHERNLVEARRLFEEVVAVGPENGAPWYVTAVYQLSQTAGADEEAARRYRDLFESLQRRGLQAPRTADFHEGRLARIAPPAPAGTRVAPSPKMPELAAGPVVLPELGGARELVLDDLDGDHRLDLVAAGPRGLFATRRGADGELAALRLAAGDVRVARAFDLNNDGETLDLLFVGEGGLAILEQDAAGAWSPTPLELPALPAPPADVVPVDFDHDGDLDLCLCGAFGARLWRNDGAARLFDAGRELPRGGFTDATAEAGLGPLPGFAWCASEDFDADQDVDLLFGGPGALLLASNLRGGRFADVTARVLADARLPRRPLLADLDGDARVDLFAPGAPSALWLQGEDGRMHATASALSVPAGAEVSGVDVDLDGALDVLWPGEGALAAGALALGLAQQTAVQTGAGQPGGPIALGDLDFAPERRNDIELVQVVAEGVRVWRPSGKVGNGARFAWSGRKDNRRAVGAVVEVRAREVYRRIYWRGPAVVVGMGDKPKIDVLRITWPNGVHQGLLNVAPGDHFPPPETPRDFGFDTSGVTTESVIQDEGLTASCPFLYAWNGTTYGFVSDVLGITPLGLPMAPGVLVPPDHDEYVLVRGSELVPEDGLLELQLTEELREVTYLDRVRLEAIDHPAGTEVFPNERFCLPPFPEPHVHSVRAPLSPARASDAEGRDWTAALAAADGVHAAPLRRRPPQFRGLAAPHWLELAFDAAAVRAAPKLRLVCTGWFRWSDASVNVAAARTPGVEFLPPVLQVPAADGTWVDAGPPLGFPAGKTKTMVIDVTGVLSRDDPRIRLRTTLELYWDRIALAVDGDDAPLVRTALEPASARLWWRGFSAPLDAELRPGEAPRDPSVPERFDWDVLADEPRWSQHPGLYTRYGECLPLVGAIDDCFVILGSGDALALRFRADALPEVPPGFVRDWLLFLDGWAKDRDPNTLEALSVEPLPFHGMSGYPYGADERFPDDEAHEAWRREWNTRPAYDPIIPLAPERERMWPIIPLAPERERAWIDGDRPAPDAARDV